MFMNDRVVAIHQPNFFPWAGYFDKILQADIFVFLDDVAYPKSGHSMGSWTNRVRIMIQGGPAWFRVPVIRESGVQIIKDVHIDDRHDWRSKNLKTLEYNYGRYPFFIQVYPIVSELLAMPYTRIADYNINIITSLANLFELDCEFHRQSALACAEHSNELLIDLTRITGGNAYISGGGAEGYQINSMFAQAGLKLINQDYRPITYTQAHSDVFIPGLSIIDIMMNLGIDGTRQYIRYGSYSRSTDLKPEISIGEAQE